ncbi:MAG: glycosyltransferase family 2 protein, partial [Amphiplicatus sp.]
MSATVSAIVVSYFTGPLLGRVLGALKAQPEIAEIILVDNGNWPNAIEEALAANAGGPPVEVLTGHGNAGFAAGCNLGAARAKGAFLLFLNPDAIMPEGGVARMLSEGAALKRPWLMGAKIIDPEGGEQQGSRRAVLTPWRAFVEAARIYKLAPRHPYFRRFNLHDEPCPAETIETDVISGACFFLPQEDYFAIGGMDEAYFLHVEDVDFCIRFLAAGGRVYFNPHVAVTHYKSSSRANAMRVEFRKTVSILRYFRRHFRDAYPPGFLWLVAGVLWLVFAAKAARR